MIKRWPFKHRRSTGPDSTDVAASPSDVGTSSVVTDVEPKPVAEQIATADRETEQLLQDQLKGELDEARVNRLGEPVNQRSPFYMGFMAALGVLLAYGLVHVLLQLTQIITFVVVALFLSLGLEPLIARLMSRGLRRAWSVLIVILGLVTALAFVGWIIVPTFADQISSLVDRAPGYLADLQHNRVVEDVDQRFHLADRIEQRVTSSLDAGSLTSLLGGVLGAGRALVDGVVAMLTVLVLTVYFMVALPSAKVAAYKLVPQRRRARVVFIGEEISRRVGGYVLGQSCVAVINGILAYIMLIVLGLPFPAVLAVLVGLLALVPIVGTVVGAVVVTLVALTAGWVTAVLALAYYIVYHVFEAYVLSPRIMHRAVDVPAVVTILAVLAGGTLLGVVGALIAIPTAAGLLLIYEQVLVPRQQGLEEANVSALS